MSQSYQEPENELIGDLIRVSIPEQKAFLFRGLTLLEEWSVSTSKFGLGTEEGSFKTPLGRFEICQKIGDGEPEGTIFKGRLPVGLWCPGESVETDMVLTRILWLEGAEVQNANTRARFIYFHVTNEESLIGSLS